MVRSQRPRRRYPAPQRATQYQAKYPCRVPITNAELAERVAGQTIPLRFLETVRGRPETVALRWKEGDDYASLTFAEYADRATRLAAALTDLGVGHGNRVVLLMRNRPEFHVADVAVLLARRHADLDLQLVVARADPVSRRPLSRPRSRSSRTRVPRPPARGARRAARSPPHRDRRRASPVELRRARWRGRSC